MMSTVTVVGLGAGLEDLTAAHYEAIQTAEVLVGGKRQLALFAEHTEATWVLGANPVATLQEVKRYAAGKRVVVLTSGDPLFFGIGERALEVFGSEQVNFLPNVTALQKAFARLKLPWNRIRTMSVHGRNPSEFFAELCDPGFIAVYTDPQNTPDRLAALFLDFGMANRRVAVVEEIGSREERLRETDLESAAGERFSQLNVMVLYPLEEETEATRFGLDEELFQREKSLITKRESRAVVLASLQLRSGDVMWDVGAGTGSVGIEAARVAPGITVYAVECNETRLEMIQENVKRLGSFGVKTVLGEAPGCLQHLPTPDRVFIGGSGGKLAEILDLVEERLSPGGRVVLSLVTLETLARAQQWVQTTRLGHEWLLLQVSRSVPISSSQNAAESTQLSRFQPQTPLVVLCLWRA